MYISTTTFSQASSRFDGTDDKATVLHHSDFDFGHDDFTIEATIREAIKGTDLTIISKRDQKNEGFCLYISPDLGIFTAHLGNKAYTMTHPDIKDGKCLFVAAKKINKDVYLYVNNTVQYFGKNNKDLSTNTDLLLGKDGLSPINGGKKHFWGIMEEVRVWDIARTDTDIFGKAKSCLSGTEPNLIAYWNIEELSGQFFHDIAPNMHHAYLGNSFFSDNEDPKWAEKFCMPQCCDVNAHFSSTTQTPFAAQWVNFITNTNASSYEWTIDNQVVATTKNLQYSFGLGVFIVRLKATSKLGCYSYYSQVIKVTDEPLMCANPNNQLSTCTEADLENPNTPLLIRDNFGNCFTPESIALPAPATPFGAKINNPNFPPGQVCDCGHFRLYFRDVIDNRTEFNQVLGVQEGYGFNHPIDGQQRRDALCRVYEDLSILISTTSSISSFVRIEVRLSDNGSGTFMAPGALGLGGTYFTDLGEMFSHGEVAKTLISGQDSYLNLNFYDPAFANLPHGSVRFNFITNFDFNLTIPITGPPSSQRDFYAVALHEAIHSLGFYSMITSNGTSAAAAWGAPYVYSMYDRYLLNSVSNIPFISNNSSSNTTCGTSGQICTHTSPTLGTITTCPTFGGSYPNNNNHDVFFDIATGFEPGVSLSHFNCIAPYSMAYIMNEAYTPNRTPNIAEVETLCDIGYTTTGIFGTSPSGGVSTLFTYSPNTCSHPCQIIGAVDIINPATSNPYFICRTTAACPAGQTTGEITINFLDIFANDNGTGNSPTGYDCLTIHGGGGCFTSIIPGANFTYQPDPTFGGWATLSYVPVCNNGGTIVRGSTTYILINVAFPPDPVCEIFAPNDCNLVCNGDFEGYNWQTVLWGNSQLNNFAFDLHRPGATETRICGGSSGQYVQIHTPNCVGAGCSGSQFLPGFNSIVNPAGGIVLELASPIEPGDAIELFFDASGRSISAIQNPAIRIFGSNTRPCPYYNTTGAIQHITGVCGTPATAIPSCNTFEPYCIAPLIDITNYQSGSIFCPSTPNLITYPVITYTHPIGAAPINYIIIGKILTGAATPTANGESVNLDNVEVYKINTIAVPMNITAAVSNPNPCIGTSTSITYDICIDASAAGALPISVDLSHNLFGSSNMNYGPGGDFDASGEKTVLLSDFIPHPATGDLCLSLTLELNIIGATNQPEDVLLLIDAGEMCFTSATVAQSLNQITTTTPLNNATTLSISPNVTTAVVSDVITYTVQMCNILPPPNGDLTGITLDILPQAGLTYNFPTAPAPIPFVPPHTFDLEAGICSTFTFTADVIADCIAPAVEVVATSSCVPYSQTAAAVVVGGGSSITFPIQMNAIPTNITTGSDGSIYATGWFGQNLDFVDGANTNSLSYTGTGGFNVFVVKYDGCGFAWAQEIPINANLINTTNPDFSFLQSSPDVEVDANGNVFVSFVFNNNFSTYTNLGGQDIAIAKFNSIGVLQWIEIDGGVEDDMVTDLELYESAGQTHIVIVGYTQGSGNAGTANSNSTSIAGSTFPYFNKLSPSNGFRYVYGVSYIASYLDGLTGTTPQWSEFIDQPTNTGTTNFVPTIPSKLSIDALGNLYFAGLAYEDFTFLNKSNSGVGVPNGFYGTPTSDIDAYVVSYSLAGNERWALTYGDNNFVYGGGESSRVGIDLDFKNNSLFLVAPFSLLFSQETHLVELNSTNGTPITATDLTDGNAIVMHSNLAIDNSGSPIVSGNFLLNAVLPSIDFYSSLPNGQLVSIPSGELTGWFVEKFDNGVNFQWVLPNTTIVPLPLSADSYLNAPILDTEVDINDGVLNCLFVNDQVTIDINSSTFGPGVGLIVRIQDQGTGGIYARPQMSSGNTIQNQNTLSVMSNTNIENTNNIATKLYPNPTTGRLTLEIISYLENNQVEQITIFDVTGRRIQQVQIDNNNQNKFEINLETQQSGVYFVEIMINQELITKRVVLMN